MNVLLTHIPRVTSFFPTVTCLAANAAPIVYKINFSLPRTVATFVHRTGRIFDRLKNFTGLRSHGTSLFQAPTSLPPFPRSHAHIKNKINNDLQVAHPQSGSSSTWFLVELEFGNVGFWGEGKTGVPGEKALGAKERTNNKLNPHMATTPGFEPGPHWWKASALTTALPLALIFSRTFHLRVIRTI